MIVALIVICITAVVAALVTEKTSVRFTSELARRRLLFSRLRIRVRATAGGDPRHFTGAAYLQRTPGLPRPAPGQAFGGVAGQGVKKILHTIKETL